MSTLVPLHTLVAVLLALAVLVASARLVLAMRAGRLGVARGVGIAVLQVAAVWLLHLVLFPPAGMRDTGVVIVLTEGGWSVGREDPVLALPEYSGGGAERVPDLATALRQYPDTRRIIVRGHGLPWRDHDAARGVDVAFEPSAEPEGLLEWQLPRDVVAGQRVLLQGRVGGIDAPVVELLDPAGRPLARATPGADGRFSMPLTLHAAGPVDFTLRVLDDGEVADDTIVPVPVGAGQALRAMLLAGAPSPELRALRRWAVDAGVRLESRIQLSRDASLGSRPDIDAAELEALDLLLLELRTWRTLDAARRDAVRDAIDAGLGVLLRLDDVPDDDDRRSLGALGFDVVAVEAGDDAVRLHPAHLLLPAGRHADAGDRDVQGEPRLTRRPVRVVADDAAALLRDDIGQPLALWRNHGQGRVALWWLDDTYPLAVQGDPTVHANLWSTVASTLARPRDLAGIDLGVDAGVSARRVICGLDGSAQVDTPDGAATALVVDARGCAGFWPESAGWHALLAADQRLPFHVGTSPRIHAHAMREATQRLAARPWPAGPAARSPTPGSPWPWFAGFLASVAALWWLERRRPAASTTPRTRRPA